MLELPNFGHMTTSTIQHDKMFLVTSLGEIITSFQNTFILRRSGVANFADIIKVATMFIKTTLKDSKKSKGIRKYVSKCNVYSYTLG